MPNITRILSYVKYCIKFTSFSYFWELYDSFYLDNIKKD